MDIINCRSVRDEMLAEAKRYIKEIGKPLTLIIVQAGNNDASNVYVRNKIKTCAEVGIEAKVIKGSENITASELKQIVKHYDEDPNVTGIIVQLPLPRHLDAEVQNILDCISWYKDVDRLSTSSIGRLWADMDCITPATPTGIMRLLPEDLSGRTVVVVNRSNLIGKPLVKLLLNRNATVNICHSKTALLPTHTVQGDIVITGTGRPNMFNEYYASVTKNQTWIDCGINRDENNNLCGDVNINALRYRSFYKHSVTPVPGGVGILTTAQIPLNVIKAWNFQNNGSEVVCT